MRNSTEYFKRLKYFRDLYLSGKFDYDSLFGYVFFLVLLSAYLLFLLGMFWFVHHVSYIIRAFF